MPRIVVPFGLSGGGPTYTLTAATGSFTLTGQSATLQVSRKLTAATGTFTYTGQAATLKVSRKLTAATGTFTYTGQSANLVVSRKLTAGIGSFSFVGQAANLVYTPISSATYTLTAQTGVFNLTGQAASFKISRKLVAETVAFSFVGNSAAFVYSGDVVPTVTKGGNGKGRNLTLKQKKKLKAVVNQEWLKAEQTVKELLEDRLSHKEPAKVTVDKLTQAQSLLDVIQALKALSKETVTLPEQQAVIKSINQTIVEKTTKQVDKTNDLERRLDQFEKRLDDLEGMVLSVLAETL